MRMQCEKRSYCPTRILTRFDKRTRHYRHPSLAELGEIMLVRVPSNERRRIQDVGQLRSLLHPYQKFRHALGVVPRRTQQGDIERRPVNLGIIPLGYLYVAASFLQRHMKRRLLLIQTTRRPSGDQSNIQCRHYSDPTLSALARTHSLVPEPRSIRNTAVANMATTAMIISAKATPTLTSEVPRKPYRNAFTMYRIGFAYETLSAQSGNMLTE